MKLDLMKLREMHPLLPAKTAAEYAHRAAVGLERHRHAPGVALETLFDREPCETSLHWNGAAPEDADQLDRIRVTEDAAEAITLALVHVARGWVVRRRLQRGEFADWLLQDSEARPVALEISGIGDGADPARFQEKLAQVARATVARQRAASVVELPLPRATVGRV